MIEPVIIGDCTLYNADCLEVLPTLTGIDSVVTDPPYGVGLKGKLSKKRGGGQVFRDGGYTSTDDTPEYIETVCVRAIKLCIEISPRIAMTPGVRCMWKYPEPTDVGCFFSAAGTGMSRWGFTCSQPILYYGKCPYLAKCMGSRPNSHGQTYPNDANGIDHPCAKPIRMWQWLVERASLEGMTVLDPFMGSGTTGVACIKTGRKFIGIEKEPKYFAIACDRIRKAYADMPLLEAV
jgi:DNA modification methylase